jgi:cytochrome c-type biogenesis protein
MVNTTGWLYFGSVWLAGVISFLSPCVLPIMPGYLAYLTGRATGRDPCAVERRQVFAHGLAFVLGFSLMFILLGASASVLGRLLLQYREWLTRAGGVLMIAFGLQMAGVIRLPFLEYGWRPQANPDPRLGFASSFLMGFFFATGWTPCIGMILGSVLTLAAYQASLLQGVLLLAVYSFGLSLPFLLIALLLDRISGWMCTLTRICRYLSILAGLILVLFGVLFAANQLSILARWLPSWDIGA